MDEFRYIFCICIWQWNPNMWYDLEGLRKCSPECFSVVMKLMKEAWNVEIRINSTGIKVKDSYMPCSMVSFIHKWTLTPSLRLMRLSWGPESFTWCWSFPWTSGTLTNLCCPFWHFLGLFCFLRREKIKKVKSSSALFALFALFGLFALSC